MNSSCLHHEYLLSHRTKPPDVVLWPTETDHVSKILKVCYSNDIPIVPFGTGTGLEGGVNALKVN